MSSIWLVAFVNMMHSVRFYFVNTAVIHEFTALLKFTYIMHTDLLRYFFAFCLLTFIIILRKT